MTINYLFDINLICVEKKSEYEILFYMLVKNIKK